MNVLHVMQQAAHSKQPNIFLNAMFLALACDSGTRKESLSFVGDEKTIRGELNEIVQVIYSWNTCTSITQSDFI